MTANQGTANQPVKMLVDGRLTPDYGPVFRNGIRNGAYKMDLGETKRVAAVNSWSFNQKRKHSVRKGDNLWKPFRHGPG